MNELKYILFTAKEFSIQIQKRNMVEKTPNFAVEGVVYPFLDINSPNNKGLGSVMYIELQGAK
ncbi:MAG: hypothetical protein ABIJ12_05770 [bacterium]